MRRELLLNSNWTFTKPGEEPVQVNVPHTWNAIDGADGGNDYWRGTCTYERDFAVPSYDPAAEEVWLAFDGVNASADVELNGRKVIHHDGGYSTFRSNITALLQAENHLKVQADNSVNDHVYPQKADFTFYGGIYRDVRLVIVPRIHLALGHLGGPGVRITPMVDAVDHSVATIRVETEVEKDSLPQGTPAAGGEDQKADPVDSGTAAIVRVALISAEQQVLDTLEGEDVTFTVPEPHLWDGTRDPYLYTVKVSLVTSRGGQEILLDEVEQHCGIRHIAIDSVHGFQLNGRPYALHGVSRHQDRKGLGNAITNAMHEQDMALIREMGANAIRLAHYQHAQYFYDLCDRYGMVVWAEIPYISEHLPFGRNNTLQQMRELITQNYNHASICVWGISNEITISTKDRKDMLDNHHVLNDLVHSMDPMRPTSLACYAMCGPFNKVAHITDAVGWNLYLGWYVPGFFLNDLWVGFFHLVFPGRPLAFTEYGAEGMPGIHAAHPHRGDQSEEYQARYHEYMLRFFERNPWMWGSFVWNMFDFAADARDQGGEPGMNHKGLVTFDRKTRKDSFYLYKAWWSEDPFVHICSKRFVNRTGAAMEIRVYSNQPAVTLSVQQADGGTWQSIGEQQGRHVFLFKVPLGQILAGRQIRIRAAAGSVTDEAEFRHVTQADPSYRVQKSRKKSNWV